MQQDGDSTTSRITSFKLSKTEPAAKPIEKTIFWRVAKLLVLNVKLLFVFDGPRRLHKRGRPAGFIPYEKTDLLKKTLRHFKVPYHQAPAEAEAECAVLQKEGVVDAAWSEDGDALMFGCELQITNYCEAVKGGRKRLTDKVSIYRARDILQQHDFNQQSFVLFAMLSGGDYNDKGLPNCGPRTAYKICKTGSGLADSLCRSDQWSVTGWVSALRDVLRQNGKYIDIPPTYPDYKTLVKYRDPVISSQYEPKQRRAWELPIQEQSLRPFLRETFNIWTRGYVKHICPILLVQSLVRTHEDKSVNDAYEVRPRHMRKTKKSQEEPSNPSTRLITFNALAVSSLNLGAQPAEEDWSVFKTKGEPEGFDPKARIECELPLSILRQAIPNDILDAPPPAPSPRKRKKKADEQAEGDGAEQPKKKRRRKTDESGGDDGIAEPNKSRKRRKPKEDAPGDTDISSKPKLLPAPTNVSVGDPLSLISPSRITSTKLATFRRPGERPSYVFGSSLDNSVSPISTPLKAGRQASAVEVRSQALPMPVPISTGSPLPTSPPAPGLPRSSQPPSPQTLRMLRIRALEAGRIGSVDQSTKASLPTDPPPADRAKSHGCPSLASSMRPPKALDSMVVDLDSGPEVSLHTVSKSVSKPAVAASDVSTGALPTVMNPVASARSKSRPLIDVIDLT